MANVKTAYLTKIAKEYAKSNGAIEVHKSWSSTMLKQGLFVADEKVIKSSIGKEVYFGEILGKHSEIHGELKKEDLTILSEDREFLDKLEEIIGSSNISGYNPLDYLDEVVNA